MPLDRSLREIVRDGLEDFLALDSRLVGTLVALLFRPGSLSIDYNEGRRIRYVPPLRLYMIASVIFFFVLALAPDIDGVQTGPADGDEAVGVEFSVDDEEEEGAGEAEATDPEVRADAPASTGTESADQAVEAADADQTEEAGEDGGLNINIDIDSDEDAPEDGSLEGRFESWMLASAARVEDDPVGFTRFMIRVVAWSMFVLLPLAALLLTLVYRRPKRYYVQHLVFTLHTHAFAFLVLAAAVGTGYLIGSDSIDGSLPMAVAMPIIAFYFYVALLRTYGNGFVLTTLKFFVVGTAYFIVQTFMLVVASILAIGLF